MVDVATLAEACQISTGKLDANAAVAGGKYPFFTCAEMPSAIDNYAYDGSVILVAGNNAQGKFHVSRYTGKFNAYQRTYILEALGDFDRDYVYYSLKLAIGRLRDSSQGSQTKFLTMPILNELGIARRCLAEQQRVTAILSAIDTKVDLNNRINAELEALAKTIYDYWFVQFDFPDAHGRPYKSSGGAMIWNDTLKREIPAGWDAGSLDDLGKIVGGSTPSTMDAANFAQGMIPWITPKDLSNNKGNKFIAQGETDVSEAGMRSASLTLHPAGTVLMSSRAPVGYLAIALNPVTTNQGFKSFVPSKGFGTSFVFYAVERSLPTIIQYASGSTFVEISGGVLKSVHAVLPDKSVTNAFCSLVEPIVKRQQQAEAENIELTQLRDWLLPLLMNGQVRVADSVP